MVETTERQRKSKCLLWAPKSQDRLEEIMNRTLVFWPPICSNVEFEFSMPRSSGAKYDVWLKQSNSRYSDKRCPTNRCIQMIV